MYIFWGQKACLSLFWSTHFQLATYERVHAKSPWTIAWRKQWHPTPVLLPGKSHGRRSLVGCSPWGREESDTTERLPFHFSLSCIGEGNGNPLQCSCLENPRDGGAWWASVYGVAQSQTWLKWLSRSSRTIAYQPPLSVGFSRQEYWSGLPCPPPGNLPDPGIEPTSLMSPALAGGFFTSSTTWGADEWLGPNAWPLRGKTAESKVRRSFVLVLFMDE